MRDLFRESQPERLLVDLRCGLHGKGEGPSIGRVIETSAGPLLVGHVTLDGRLRHALKATEAGELVHTIDEAGTRVLLHILTWPPMYHTWPEFVRVKCRAHGRLFAPGDELVDLARSASHVDTARRSSTPGRSRRSTPASRKVPPGSSPSRSVVLSHSEPRSLCLAIEIAQTPRLLRGQLVTRSCAAFRMGTGDHLEGLRCHVPPLHRRSARSLPEPPPMRVGRVLRIVPRARLTAEPPSSAASWIRSIPTASSRRTNATEEQSQPAGRTSRCLALKSARARRKPLADRLQKFAVNAARLIQAMPFDAQGVG